MLEGLSERSTIQELGRKHKIHPPQVTNWKSQFLKNGEEVFSKKAKSAKTGAEEKEERLLKPIGQLKVEFHNNRDSIDLFVGYIRKIKKLNMADHNRETAKKSCLAFID